MSGFFTFSVYSLRIATDMPLQSDYMPDIASYFLASITLNMISFVWFVYMNRCLLRSEIPVCLDKFADLLKKLFCICFPDEKKVSNSDSLNIVVKDAEKAKMEEKLEIVTNLEGKKMNKKEKCGLCDRCNSCEADFKKDKDKGKRKKEIESKFDALNYLAFVIMLIAMVASNMGIWINLNTKYR